MLNCRFWITSSIFTAILFAFALTASESLALGKSCNYQEKFSLAVHGGAVWRKTSHTKKETFISDQLKIGRERLAKGDKAIDVVGRIIAAMEDSGLFNAGKGSIANKSGEIEMDASIMDGKHLLAGAVASIRKLQNPIYAARIVMDKTPHVMMAGAPADKHLAKLGAAKVQQSYFLNSAQNFSDISLPSDIAPPQVNLHASLSSSRFVGVWGGVLNGRLNHIVILSEMNASGGKAIVAFGANEDLGIQSPITINATATFLNGFLIVETEKFRVAFQSTENGNLEAILSVKNGARVSGELKRRPDLLKKSGTVGAVAMDKCGDLAAGTSTGGFISKVPGRVGDSPIIGAGTYADNRSVAVSATGHGEYFIRFAVAHEIAARIRHGGETLVQATYRVVMKELKNNGGEGGVIAVDKNGEVVMMFNTKGMVRGRTTDKLSPKVETYFND